MELITERHNNEIKGTLSCFDRVVLQGIIPEICYDRGMTGYLYSQGIKIFDYETKFASPLRDQIMGNAKRIAEMNKIEIEYIKKKDFRKEDRIQRIIKERGSHPGLVHIFSALEPCTKYRHWFDKTSKKAYLKSDTGMCLHYYFYIIDENYGLMYIRVPTWCPFRLQIYFNGHNWLHSQLEKKGIESILIQNAFVSVSDFKKSQQIASNFDVMKLHKKLDQLAEKYCPVIKKFSSKYHFSIWQAEYSTDIIFNKKEDLSLIYEKLIRTAVHSVKPEHIATFLGKKLHGAYQGEMGNDLNTRIAGMRIRHCMGQSSIKMYDKFGIVLRIETTTYNVAFFKHYREVEQRNGNTVTKFAALKKSIYSLPILQQLLGDANRRYLEFISSFEDTSSGKKDLEKLVKPIKQENNHSYRGFNFLNNEDDEILRVISSGEFCISGFRNKNLCQKLLNKTTGQISRILKRLRLHGLIKKIRGTLKYYITTFGRRVIATALTVREFFIIPNLSH